MPKIHDAAFPQNPKTASPVFYAATVMGDVNEPTNTQLLFTAGPEGAVLTGLWCMPCGVTPATAAYLFRVPEGGTTGAKRYLIDSEAIPALSTFPVTAKITKTKFSEYSEQSTLRLGAYESLYGAIGVACPKGVVFFVQESEYDDPTA